MRRDQEIVGHAGRAEGNASPPPRDRASARRGVTRPLARVALAAGLFLVFAALRVGSYLPPLPNPLALELLLDPQPAGRSDPIVVGGVTGAGDFLTARFRDEKTLVFVYDSWGHPGIESQPVAFEPGRRLRLVLEVPILHQVRGAIAPASDRVRVTCDGVRVLDAPCHFQVRRPDQLWLGENPIGGSACGPTLHGKLWRADGREVRGTPHTFFSAGERLAGWFRHSPWQPIAWLLLSGAIAFFGDAPLRRFRSAGGLHAVTRAFAQHRPFVISTAFATLAYTWLVTGGSFNFNHEEVFGNFYDYQASSLLQGRLDVPDVAIGGEAFVVGEKTYGYFGPTPALLRMPFVVLGLAFGKLSRAFMVLYFVASLVAAYLLLREATRLARGRPEAATPSPWAVGTLVASTGLGSTIFFLGSRGLIFHEAILGGITFALWSCWCALRHLRAPGGRWWMGALLGGLLSIHTRPPTGLFALTFLGCVGLAIALAEWRTRKRIAWRRHASLGVLCAVAVLSLNGLAYLKFGTFDAAPLRISRPYTDPGRLEKIDGKSFHLVNVPYNLYTYVLRPNLRLEPQFPWIYLGERALPRAFPKAKIDLADHTVGLPWAMPSLFALATLGCLGAAIALPATRAPIVALWAAVLPMTLALFAAVATAQRYTGDWVPFLVVAGAFGLAGLERAPPLWRALLRCVVLALTAVAIAVTAAITLHYQGDTLWGVPEATRKNYQAMRARIDGWFAPAGK